MRTFLSGSPRFLWGLPALRGLVFLLGGYPENKGGKRGGKDIFVGKATDYGGPKLPPHSGSYSEAASVNRGERSKGGGTAPPPLAASFFPDSFFAGEEKIGPPEGGSWFVW